MLIAAAALLASCAAQTAGNSLGGTIDWFGMTAALAQQKADQHCSKYGRRAHITSIVPRAGGHVIFECK